MHVLIATGAGVMAAGFIDWQAGALVAGLTLLTYVLLGTLAPRTPAPAGRGRLMRVLRRHGYQIVTDGMPRHLVIGPGGVYLLETRVWQNVVSRGPGDWRIGGVPAGRVADRLAGHAARLERAMDTLNRIPGLAIVPVIMVAGRLPEPVMRSGRAVIARPRNAVHYILDRSTRLDQDEIDALADEAASYLARDRPAP
ncbi:MAG: hypothetical protein M0026_04020 [Nocardiopsaceae bacterium]|nr:hypothetical protein [Nocardiopsaceae bacterium]